MVWLCDDGSVGAHLFCSLDLDMWFWNTGTVLEDTVFWSRSFAFLRGNMKSSCAKQAHQQIGFVHGCHSDNGAIWFGCGRDDVVQILRDSTVTENIKKIPNLRRKKDFAFLYASAWQHHRWHNQHWKLSPSLISPPETTTQKQPPPLESSIYCYLFQRKE